MGSPTKPNKVGLLGLRSSRLKALCCKLASQPSIKAWCDAIMGIVMVAMLAFGGTFAYFTATTTAKTGTFKTGIVNLSAGDYTISTSTLVPGDAIVDKAVTYENKSDVATYVFVKYEVAVDKTSEVQLPAGTTVDSLIEAEGLGDGWTKLDEVNGVYYKALDAAAADTKTLTFATAIKLNSALASNSHDGTAGSLMNIKLTLTISARSIQQNSFTGEGAVKTAYDAAFATTVTEAVK